MLDKFIAHMKQRPGVWFATHEQIARHVQAAKQLTQKKTGAGFEARARDVTIDTLLRRWATASEREPRAELRLARRARWSG